MFLGLPKIHINKKGLSKNLITRWKWSYKILNYSIKSHFSLIISYLLDAILNHLLKKIHSIFYNHFQKSILNIISLSF